MSAVIAYRTLIEHVRGRADPTLDRKGRTVRCDNIVILLRCSVFPCQQLREPAIADDRDEHGPKDCSRVNIKEPWKVRWWAKKWNVTEAELRTAHASTGPMASNIARRLGKQTP
jgi:hypothetical protein